MTVTPEEFEAHLNQIKEESIDRAPVKYRKVKKEHDFFEVREIVRDNIIFSKGYLKALLDYNIPVPDSFAQIQNLPPKMKAKPAKKQKITISQKKPKSTIEKNNFDLLDI